MQGLANFIGFSNDFVFLKVYDFKGGGIIFADAAVTEVGCQEHSRRHIGSDDVFYVVQPYIISTPHKGLILVSKPFVLVHPVQIGAATTFLTSMATLCHHYKNNC